MAVPADRAAVVTRRRVPARLARWLTVAVAYPDGRSGDVAPVPLTPQDLRDLAWAAEAHGLPGYAQRRAEREGLVGTGLAAVV